MWAWIFALPVLYFIYKQIREKQDQARRAADLKSGCRPTLISSQVDGVGVIRCSQFASDCSNVRSNEWVLGKNNNGESI